MHKAYPIVPGAQSFSFDGGGEIGVLLNHGFTGSPASMRPWGEYLAEQGFTVRCERLPGHGTSWQDMNKTTWEDWYATDAAALDDLLSRCSSVFVFGLSMGGTLTLKLAQEYGDRIAGIGLVNASVITERKDYKYLLPIAKYFLRGKKGLGNDIAKPDTSEGSYGMTPIKATVSLGKLWPIVRRDLPKVTQPALIMRSAVDHVVEPVNFDIIIQGISSSDVTAEILPNSFHVATLDYDAPRIFELSTAFARRIHDSVKGPSHAK